jgi:alkylmercury lyase
LSERNDAMTNKKNIADDLAVEIRPGVLRPDWSVVTTSAARQALRGRVLGRSGLLEHWSRPLDTDADRIWQNLLRLFVRNGRPPRADEIAAESKLPCDSVTAILHELAGRDLIGLEPGTDVIRFAYPWTAAPSGHRVALGAHSLWALCAIDALAAARMYRADASIDSACTFCAGKIYVATALRGRALRTMSPPEAVVWYDFAFAGCAAASCCPSIVFLCSDAHLEAWLSSLSPRPEGVRLSMTEALEVGGAIFGPVLRDPVVTGAA